MVASTSAKKPPRKYASRLLAPEERKVRECLEALERIYTRKATLNRLNDQVTPVDHTEIRGDFANVIHLFDLYCGRINKALEQDNRLADAIDDITINVQQLSLKLFDRIIEDFRPLYARAIFEVVRDWGEFLTTYRNEIAYLRQRGR